ncbi:hypothetical protein BVRB_4g082450 [Beta vulgaris subsp. vulgaris]|uniref:bifunctional TH2 protein, mitochondrial n=1 Tax=Beta vulgaris subsp. vulgaris TaxID=3555 RepID=UPI00065C5BE3|nr:bifunctional TH2 protein, mitochondrial [Beta vulgaris subsp. vulgaris]KMT13466.1 hypothetical protein BVRB_4g082450 [Beta vulgaris subsp. vulgaris]
MLQKLGDDSIEYIESYGSFFEELGLEYKPGSVPKNGATARYIDSLLAAARTKNTAFAFAAITPCIKLYAYLGSEVKNALNKEELEANKYKRWIIENSSEDPQPSKLRNLKTAKEMDYFLDKLSAGLPQKELDEIEKIYKEGLEHETEFNLAQLIDGQEVVVPLFKELKGFKFPFVSNFDLCCIKTPEELKRLEDYEESVANALLIVHPPDKYSFEAIHEAFGSASVTTLEKKNGLNLGVGQFKAESGCISLSLKVLQKENLDASAYVISAFWSDDKIKSALTEGGLVDKISHAGNKGSVESSIDKLEAFNNILQKNNMLSLYIGDSVGDLLCLLKANIGVVYGSNVNLEHVEEHFLVTFVPLFKGLIHKQMEYKEQTSLLSWKPSPGVIYNFTHWAEIEAFILGS